MRERTALVLIAAPMIGVVIPFLLIPMGNIFFQSFLEYRAGFVGANADSNFTLQNYEQLLDGAYVQYFVQTFKLASAGASLSVILAFPIACFLARTRSPGWRRIGVGVLVCMILLSTLVRVYALQLTFGPVGLGRIMSAFAGLRSNSRGFGEGLIIAGLVHFLLPLNVLTLMATIQNINPRLIDAAQSLGAGRWRSHLAITVPLSTRGIVSALAISFSLSISSFVIPMILGSGKIVFISNLIYSRFSEVANYQSGSALGVILLVIALMVVLGMTQLIDRFLGRESPRWSR